MVAWCSLKICTWCDFRTLCSRWCFFLRCARGCTVLSAKTALCKALFLTVRQRLRLKAPLQITSSSEAWLHPPGTFFPIYFFWVCGVSQEGHILAFRGGHVQLPSPLFASVVIAIILASNSKELRSIYSNIHPISTFKCKACKHQQPFGRIEHCK